MLIVLGEFRVTQDKREAFAVLAQALGDASRREEGCHFFELWSDLEGTGRFALVEGWEGPDRLRAHRTMPHVAEFRSATEQLGIEGFEVARYEVSGPVDV